MKQNGVYCTHSKPLYKINVYLFLIVQCTVAWDMLSTYVWLLNGAAYTGLFTAHHGLFCTY